MALKPSRSSRAFLFSFLPFVLAVLSACDAPRDIGNDSELAESSSEEIRGETMGTSYHVRFNESLGLEELHRLRALIEREFEAVNASMSNYLPESELSRLNRGPAGVAIEVSPPLMEVLLEAEHVHSLTDGAFDITVAPLVRLWGFGPGAERVAAPPSRSEIEAQKRHIGLEKLVLSVDEGMVTKKIEELELDLSGIAKGYAVDRAAKALMNAGRDDFMVEVGGELTTRGRNKDGEPWRIAIEVPSSDTRRVQRIVPLSGLAMATSGDYRNFYEVDGEKFTHLIDPRRGRPVEHRLASVSVVGERCAASDALASGLLVLGPELGPALAERLEIAALFQIRRTDNGFEEKMTDTLRVMIESAAPAPSER